MRPKSRSKPISSERPVAGCRLLLPPGIAKPALVLLVFCAPKLTLQPKAPAKAGPVTVAPDELTTVPLPAAQEAGVDTQVPARPAPPLKGRVSPKGMIGLAKLPAALMLDWELNCWVSCTVGATKEVPWEPRSFRPSVTTQSKAILGFLVSPTSLYLS